MPTHSVPSPPLAFAIVTVSTSRSAAGGADVNDRSGDTLAALAVSGGHSVCRRALVPDDPLAISGALAAALASEAQVVVLTGGTGISARDCTPGVIREALDRELPGFGELFRMLSYQQVGSKAMLSTAVGGIVGGKVVFSVPGATRACELAMEKLILPELGHIFAELTKEGAAAPSAPPPPAAHAGPPPGSRPAAARANEKLAVAERVEDAPVPTGITVSVAPDAERMDAPPIASGWEAGLRALFGVVERVQPEIPEGLSRMQPVVDVLNSAGTRATVRLPDGRSYGAWGFPDLARRGSKVLLVREAVPLAEIVVLHRWPSLVGVCAEEGGVLPDAQLALAAFTEDRTGRPYEGAGELFAVDGASVWITLNRKVFRWDGKRSEDVARATAEPLSSALATLVLGWSGR